MRDEGCIITQNFDSNPGSVLGKLVIAPTPQAQLAWDLFRKNPTLYEFAVGYIGELQEDGTYKNCELVEISLVMKHGGKKHE